MRLTNSVSFHTDVITGNTNHTFGVYLYHVLVSIYCVCIYLVKFRQQSAHSTYDMFSLY